MTTIAYDGRYVAIDSQVTQGDTRFTGRKTYDFKTVDGVRLVCWGSGDVAYIQAAVAALRDGLKLPKGDYMLLVWGYAERLVEHASGGPGCEITWVPYAAGSGQHAALGAMHAGCDAPQAVEIACKVDTGSGPPVVVFDTETGRFVPKRQKRRT